MDYSRKEICCDSVDELKRIVRRHDLAERESCSGTYEWDVKGNKIYWSAGLYRVFDVDEGTTISIERVKKCIHPDDLAGWQKSVDACLAGVEPHDFTFRLIDRLGRTKWLHSLGDVVHDETGEAGLMCGIVIDETKKRDLEETLNETKQKLTVIESVSKTGTWSWDIEEDIVNWSDELFRFFEMDPAEGAPPVSEQHKLFAPSDFQRLEKALNHAIETKTAYAIKLPVISRGGSIKVGLARGRPILNEQGDVVRLWGFLEDITALEKIDRERELLKEAIENSNEIVSITDVNGAITYVNKAFENITGYSFEDVVGKSLCILKSKDQDEQVYEEMWAALKSGRNWSGQLVDSKKDGTEFTEHSSISPVFDEYGNITHYISLKRDITEELARERKFQESQKLESLGKLAGGVAHDFNNMLQVIIGHGELVSVKLKEKDIACESLDIMLKAARRSGNLTAQLLAFAREQPAIPKVIYLNEVLEDLLKMLKRILGENIQVVLDLGPEVWPVKMDPVQVDQIITNLCVNARDAISDSGIIKIETRNVSLMEPLEENKTTVPPGDYIKLSISDTGHGISKAILPKIFDPFFTTKPIGAGTGLGLATVHGIVMQNGGLISVRSAYDTGTSFSIYFPKAEDSEKNITKTGIHPVEEQFHGNILLVEDEELILDLTSEYLSEIGFTVYRADTVERAIAIVESLPGDLDLLITDVIMPGKNGKQLSEIVSRHQPKAKVLYISGYPAQIVSKQGLITDQINFLSKPFSMDDLRRKISQIMTLDVRGS